MRSPVDSGRSQFSSFGPTIVHLGCNNEVLPFLAPTVIRLDSPSDLVVPYSVASAAGFDLDPRDSAALRCPAKSLACAYAHGPGTGGARGTLPYAITVPLSRS